jgi:hypothetical protein
MICFFAIFQRSPSGETSNASPSGWIPQIGRTSLHPFYKITNHRLWKRLLRWTLDPVVPKCLDDAAYLRFSRDNCRPRFTAADHSVASVQQPLTADFFRVSGMALVHNASRGLVESYSRKTSDRPARWARLWLMQRPTPSSQRQIQTARRPLFHACLISARGFTSRGRRGGRHGLASP